MFGLLMLVVTAGCAAGPGASIDPLGAAPPDFSLDVTVLTRPATTSAADERAAPLEAHLRPSRSILFPDGSLCYGPDPDSRQGVNWVPPIARILTRREIAEIWSLAQQLGWTDPNAGDPVINFKLVTPERGERIYLIGFSGSERRWNFIRRAPIEAPPDPAASRLVQHLAKLVWADETDASVKFMPKRYDLGPDPYSRYRTSASEEQNRR